MLQMAEQRLRRIKRFVPGHSDKQQRCASKPGDDSKPVLFVTQIRATLLEAAWGESIVPNVLSVAVYPTSGRGLLLVCFSDARNTHESLVKKMVKKKMPRAT